MKKLWIALIVIGIIPFVVPIAYGISSAINGYSGLCLWPCTNEYGFGAFYHSISLYTVFFWPTYIIGSVLIVVSIIKLVKNKKRTNK